MEKYSFIDRSGKLKLSVCVARVRKHTHPLLGHSTAAWAASIKAAVFYQFFLPATYMQRILIACQRWLLNWWTDPGAMHISHCTVIVDEAFNLLHSVRVSQ